MNFSRFRAGAVRYGLPGVLVGMAVAWGMGLGRGPTARAQAPAVAEATGTIAFTAASPGSTPRLYLIDTRARAFAIYRLDPQKGAVQLEAARQYRCDLQLSEYNNLPPEVAAVEAMVSTTTPRK